MKVVVIGNSRDLLDKEDGEKIDQFDRIIRLNSFKLEGCEKHVGSRIDIVSMHMILEYFSEVACSAHLIRQASEIWVPWPRDLATDQEVEHAANVMQRRPEDFIFVEDPEQKKMLRSWYKTIYDRAEKRPGKKTQMPDGRKYLPTTGFLTIHLAKARFPEADIYITGFSLTSGQDMKRFSTSDNPMWPGHDMLTERALLLESIEKGELQKL